MPHLTAQDQSNQDWDRHCAELEESQMADERPEMDEKTKYFFELGKLLSITAAKF